MARRCLLWMVTTLAVGFLLVPPLRWGWTHVATDFPNYYTAALLARRGAPLRNFYNWTWFQRQMNYAGWGMQLGGYIPHTPLTMLPVLPLTALPPLPAKRAWLAVNVAMLAASLWMLAKLTRLPLAGLILLGMAGYEALAGNFRLGQCYVFLLFLLTWSFWFLIRGRPFRAGLVLGAIFALKLYAGPFLLYFAWKRRWRELAGMTAAVVALGCLAIALFGWKDNLYYVTDVLPRALAGESIHPYAPGMPVLSNMLRHAFVLEPELNPYPLVHAPGVAFFLQPFLTLSAVVFCLIALPRSQLEDPRHELAWFVVMLLLISPTRAFYVGVLLLLPMAFLMDKTNLRRCAGLAAAYLLFTLSLPAAWAAFFPTLWILLALYLILGIKYWRSLRPAIAVIAAAAILGVAALATHFRLDSYYREPPQKFERVMVNPKAMYSGSPAISASGIIYESIGPGRYLLQRWNQGTLTDFAFQGHAFHPSVRSAGGAIYFELVADGHSRIMRFDPATKALQPVVSPELEPTHPAISPDQGTLAFIARDRIVGAPSALDSLTPVHDIAWFPTGRRLAYSAGPPGSSQIYAPQALTHGAGDHTEPAISPDGTTLAFTLTRGGTRQVWLQNLASGEAKPLTEGNCNSYSPAWEPDSRALVFASDCERGLGLGTLYRARLI